LARTAALAHHGSPSAPPRLSSPGGGYACSHRLTHPWQTSPLGFAIVIAQNRAVYVRLSRRMVSIRGCHSQACGTALATARYSHDGTSLLCRDGKLARESLYTCGTLSFGDRLSLTRGTALSLSSHLGSASQHETLAGQCHAVQPGIGVRRNRENHAETRYTSATHGLTLDAHTSGTVLRHPREPEHRRT
jgi:hypothetical protein